MNIYFLVEGKQTERKVYPKWLGHLIPELTQKRIADDVDNNDYYLISGEGYPSILKHIANSIEEINELAKFNYFVIVVDADEETVISRFNEIKAYIDNQKTPLNDKTELVIIVQNRTIETWFLGNEKIFKSNPQNEKLRIYQKHYNVKTNDPELMPVLANSTQTHAQFHSDYCKLFLKERHISYSKVSPNGVIEKAYLDCLIQRNEKTAHLQSFKTFIDFCEEVRKEMV